MTSTHPVAVALSGVTLGLETSFENLVMFPLLAREPKELREPREPYLLLGEALSLGLAEITEVSEAGSVPELLVVNSAHRPILIVDGEELVGAKQNRIVNLTILVPAASKLTIPVSCVEAGRWRARSRAFAAAPRAQYATGRAKRMAQVTASMHARGDHGSDQAAVWSDIAFKSARLGARSPTAAMEAIYTSHSSSIERFVEACRPFDEQVGALFGVGGTIVGMDLFDRQSTLRRMLPKLVRSVAVDAIDQRIGDSTSMSSSTTMRSEAEQFLAAVATAPFREATAIGCGTDVRLARPGLAGAALVADGVVHLTAFSAAALA